MTKRLAPSALRLAFAFTVALLSGCSEESAPSAASAPSTQGDVSYAGFYTVEHATRTLDDSPRDLLRGFGFEIKSVMTVGGSKLAVSRLGELVALSDLRRVEPSAFRGVKSPDPALRVAFVWRGPTAVLAEPRANAAVVARVPRLSILPLVSRSGPAGYYATATGWLAAGDVRVPTLSRPPPGVARHETWIDVDLGTQTLVLYEGERPVFVTLISGGVGVPGSNFATPLGVHRIIAKLRSATMDNLEHTDVVEYFYESVPFTQYIGRVGLHAVYWHDDFGRPKSHGCINLSMADAAYLFDATSPKVASDAAAARGERGTVVQVR